MPENKTFGLLALCGIVGGSKISVHFQKNRQNTKGNRCYTFATDIYIKFH